jgi:formylglycine-generating enzyme required for sulfatase activity
MTGEVPVDATERVRRDPLVPVSQHPVSKGAYSADLCAAVDEALKVDEDARPQSVAAWRALLSSKAAPTEKLAPVKPADPVPSRAQKDTEALVALSLGLKAAAVARKGTAQYTETHAQKAMRWGLTLALLVMVLVANGVELLLSGQGTQPDAAPGPAAVTAPEVPSEAGLDDSMAAPSLAQEETAPQPSLPEMAATRRVGDVFRDGFTSDSGEGPEMVVLPSGNFTMGSPVGEEGRWDDEGPQRIVRIGYEFAVGKYEVTFAEWDTCVADGGCGRYRPDDLGWGRGARPVINVSWEDAQAYVAWLNQKTGLTGRSDRYRLPSEAEWEYAARAGSQGPWSFGDDESRLGNFAWFDSNSGGRTQPVGGKTANGFGLHDMHGNVWEWVEDCWNGSYSGALSDGSAGTTSGCSSRRSRGGSWLFAPQILRSANRNSDSPGNWNSNTGFRLARTLP